MRHTDVTNALLVEDDLATAERVSSLLTRTESSGDVHVVHATTGQGGLDALQRARYGVVVVGLAGGDPARLELLDTLRILAAGAPLLAWAPDVSPALRDEALTRGASAVVDASTDLDAVLHAAIAGAGFESAVRDALREARTGAGTTQVAVLQLHVAEWNAVTAGCSREQTNTLVELVHERLAGRLAADDTLVDLGGGRHGIIAIDAGHEAEARGLAQELVEALERPFRLAGAPVTLEAACGWVLGPGDAPSAEGAVRRSAPDQAEPVRTTPGHAPAAALPGTGTAAESASPAPRRAPVTGAVATDRAAKLNIRENVSNIRPVTVAEALAQTAGGATAPDVEPLAPAPAPGPRRGFARRLRAAIAAGELVLHYQPIVRLGDDTIPVVEALVRWKLPTPDGSARFLPPVEFIPLAEETGAIEEIGAFALQEACRQMREWDDAGLAPVRVAVNLSARELCSPALPARVADALAESGLSADRLELELTESMFADPEGTAKMLRRLRALGVRVAIDDFGTGYSSLGYLTRFAVDVIKVDGAFVRRAADDSGAAEVVRAIVAIAHQLDLEVVAEGVETTEQLAFVTGENVDLVQGYLFCEPLPADAAGTWLAWAEDVVAQETPARRRRRRGVQLSRREQALRGATLAVAATAGAVVALPVHMPAASECPPAGEGLLSCQLQNGYAPAFTLFMIVLTAVYVAIDLARRAPALIRDYRSPAARARRAHKPTLPGADSDPLLLAATWGVTAPPNTVAAATAVAQAKAERAAAAGAEAAPADAARDAVAA